jgi:hypothetical protein
MPGDPLRHIAGASLAQAGAGIRRKQSGESEARVIPESLRRRRHERDRDESMQFKRAFRQQRIGTDRNCLLRARVYSTLRG